MNIINLADKKFLKKLAKDLNNWKYHLDEKSSLEIYKPSGSKIYVLVNNKSNLTIFRNMDLSLVKGLVKILSSMKMY